MHIVRAFGPEMQVASRLAREAGDVIMKIYPTDFAVSDKPEHDPVTAADRLASRLIVQGLRREFPGDFVVSEEEPVNPMSPWPTRIWYVDPLDGTREFIKRNGEFAVMIGLTVDGRARAGVVFLPATNQLFAGVVGEKAWVEKAEAVSSLHVSRETRPSHLRLVSSRSHRHGLLDEMRRRLGISEERRVGSVGVKVGLILAQEAEVYLEPSTATKAWDSCAPEAILSAAGGRLTDLRGAPLRYTPHDLRNSRGLAATNGACHDFVISKIAPVLHGRG